MKKKLIIFGCSSFLSTKIIKNLSKKYNILGFSQKKIKNSKNVKYIKTDYDIQNILFNLKKEIKKNEKPILIFFNAVAETKAFINLNQSEIKNFIKINLTLPLLLSNIVIKNFFYQKPNFIYFSSSRAFYGDVGISVYSATKIALVNFARCLSLEYGNYDLNFKVILLGLVKGGLVNKLSKKKINEILNRSKIPKFIKIKEIIKILKSTIDKKTSKKIIIKCDNGYR